MERINFQDGQKTSSAKVTIDGVDYPVTPARYSGATPLSSLVMNTMQDNIEDAIDQNAINIGGEDYDSTATYEEGDIVKYEGQLYICIEAIDTPEEWDSTKWNATDVLSSAGGNEVTIGTSADITGKTKLFVEESTQTLKYKNSTTGQFENLTSEDIVIGEPEDVTEETKIFIDESEGTDAYSEVVNSLAGNEIAKAPSVHAVNQALDSQWETLSNDNKVLPDNEKIDASGIEHNNSLLSDILQNNIYHIVAPSTGSSGSTSVTFNLGRYNMRCFLVTFTKGTNDQSGNSALWYMSANGIIAALSNPQNYTLSVSINRNTGDITLTASGLTYATMTVIVL